jgi:hypothetical protein
MLEGRRATDSRVTQMHAVLARRAGPWAVLALVPFAAHLPLAALGVTADPIYYVGGLTAGLPRGLLPGLPGWADPSSGFTTEALGGLAAHDWLHGILPWWNPYSGVGLPLAAEMQPSAFFLPFTLLLALPGGVLWLKIALQALAGWTTFALLHQLDFCARIALLGGVLYQLNGTFAWFADAPIHPIPFLPLLLLGIERSFLRARAGRPGGWGWTAIATGGSLYAGYPETAYIDGLLAVAWGVLRLATIPGAARPALARKLTAGALLGPLMAAPVVLPFLQYLPLAATGGHDVFGSYHLDTATYALFVLPYFYGPVQSGAPQWGVVGGYVGLPLLFLAAMALRGEGRGRALRGVLAGWIMLAIAKTAQVPGIAEAMNVIPFIGQTAFFRYAPPTWELAAVVLACFALEDWQRGLSSRRAIVPAIAVAGAAAAVALVLARPEIRVLLHASSRYLVFMLASLIGAVGITAGIASVLASRSSMRRAVVLHGLVAANAVALFSAPLLSARRPVALDLEAIDFLQRHLGLSRCFTLGPLQPNFSALFGIASINHNYVPVARLWVDYVRAHLDPGADDLSFTGTYPLTAPGQETRAEALRHRVAAYAGIGVKFVLAPPGSDPFPPNTAVSSPPRVFHDAVMDIYELPDPAAYFAIRGGDCTLAPIGREMVEAQRAAPATLLRRELFYPGWRAEVNGAAASISLADEIFQSVDLPAGHWKVRFRYAPPYIGWAWGAGLLGFAGLLTGLRRCPRAGGPTAR